MGKKMSENTVVELEELIRGNDVLLADRRSKTSQLQTLGRRLFSALLRKKKKVLEAETGVSVYASHDYSGMSCGPYRFYYGYEYTVCQTHGAGPCDCEDSEWAFVAWRGEDELLRIPASKLDTRLEVEMALLHGVGQFIKQFLVVEEVTL